MSGSKSVTGGKPASVYSVRSRVVDRVTAHLRKVHPLKTADAVAADTGLPVTTIRKWLSRESTPNAPAMLMLIGTYGPELLAAALHSPPGWLDSAARAERLAALEARAAELNREMEKLR